MFHSSGISNRKDLNFREKGFFITELEQPNIAGLPVFDAANIKPLLVFLLEAIMMLLLKSVDAGFGVTDRLLFSNNMVGAWITKCKISSAASSPGNIVQLNLI